MIETLAFYTGVLVWILVAIYVAPLLPYLVIMLTGVVVERIGQLWTDMYLTSECRAERLEELSDRHEDGDWRVTVTLVLGRAKRVLYRVAERYACIVMPAYSRLPVV